MVTIHLGVIDLPYAHNAPRRVTVRKTRGSTTTHAGSAPASGGETTGDVAQILEDKYHVMELYVEEIGIPAIQTALEHSAEGALENLALGAPTVGLSLTAEAMGELETAFRLFIDQQELDGVVPGVPTLASLKGVNHRLKHPYAKSNPSRPSFRDTGTYQAAFKAWTEEE